MRAMAQGEAKTPARLRDLGSCPVGVKTMSGRTGPRMRSHQMQVPPTPTQQHCVTVRPLLAWKSSPGGHKCTQHMHVVCFPLASPATTWYCVSKLSLLAERRHHHVLEYPTCRLQLKTQREQGGRAWQKLCIQPELQQRLTEETVSVSSDRPVPKSISYWKRTCFQTQGPGAGPPTPASARLRVPFTSSSSMVVLELSVDSCGGNTCCRQ